MTRCRCGGRCAPCRRRAFGDASETLALIAKVGASLGLQGPSDPIGRLGPVAIEGGRTLSNPCAGRTLCDDADVLAWLREAKSWTDAAGKLRDNNVIYQFGATVSRWPEKARLAEVLYRAARDAIGGEPGFLDRTQVGNYANAVFLAKASFEFFLRSIEDVHGIPEMELGPELRRDPIRDPSNLPPYVPWPEFPFSLPSLGSIGLWAGLILLAYMLIKNRK